MIMKVILKYVCVLWLISNLMSCESKEGGPLTTSSPNGEMDITVTGTKESWAEPWVVKIEAEYNGVKKAAMASLYASELNEETILFEWKTERHCRITLLNRDGEEDYADIKF